MNYESCIEACNLCAKLCYKCFKADLFISDVSNRRNCILTNVECAAVCQLASSIMSMNAEHVSDVCSVCSIVCDKCAEECKKFTDDINQRCANACIACAIECRNMVSC